MEKEVRSSLVTGASAWGPHQQHEETHAGYLGFPLSLVILGARRVGRVSGSLVSAWYCRPLRLRVTLHGWGFQIVGCGGMSGVKASVIDALAPSTDC